MKRLLVLILVLVCAVLFWSCSENETKEDSYISFGDDSGFEVLLEEKPKKIAVLFSSHAEMVLLAGGSVDVTVGETIERGFAQEGTPLVDDGAGKKINCELLIAQNPDLVIGSYDIAAHKETAELMRKAGVPTALFHVESFYDYERVMGVLCRIFDSQEMYNKNVSSVRTEIESVLENVPKGKEKKILFIRCASTSKATKAKTKDQNFVCAMLDEMNTYNIAENVPLLLDGLSIEHIILENPDYIFFSTMGNEDAAKAYMTDVMSRDEWQTLSAVKNGKYTFLDKELFQYKPNSRWGKAYKTLAELLYE